MKAKPERLIEQHWDDLMRQVGQGMVKFGKRHLFAVWAIDLRSGAGKTLGMALAVRAGRGQEMVAYLMDCARSGADPAQTVCMGRKRSIAIAGEFDKSLAAELRARPKDGHVKAVAVQGDSVSVFDLAVPEELLSA